MQIPWLSSLNPIGFFSISNLSWPWSAFLAYEALYFSWNYLFIIKLLETACRIPLKHPPKPKRVICIFSQNASPLNNFHFRGLRRISSMNVCCQVREATSSSVMTPDNSCHRVGQRGKFTESRHPLPSSTAFAETKQVHYLDKWEAAMLVTLVFHDITTLCHCFGMWLASDFGLDLGRELGEAVLGTCSFWPTEG